ncbi:MAG: hypothetical protein Q7T63_15760 [Burkholderiaceae bacterium]|nr:hypothetical protein [Burkholderiaceae bacterium]MDP3136368.1 hypothetical protein [Burkholderiaceae bacterium]
MKFWWFAASIGSICGALVMAFGYPNANSAPQEAAIAAMAVAAAVVPYTFARCLHLFGAAEREERRHQELLQALKKLGDPAVAGDVLSVSAPSGIGASSPPPSRP